MEVSLKCGDCSARIAAHGAELKSLVMDGREFMWSGDPAYWPNTAPVMFPMIGTLKDNKTIILGEEYSLPKHGFTRDMELTPEDVGESSVMFSLEQSDYTKRFYPFDFRFTIRYTLRQGSLEVTHTVRNNDKYDMPYCIGGHPAFAFDGELSDYRLEFPMRETLAAPVYNLDVHLFEDENRVPVLDDSDVLQLNHEMFYRDVVYLDKVKSRSVKFLGKDGRGLRLDYPDFTSLAVWQAKNAPFLCVEPFCGSADFSDCTGVFAEKRGIELLKPDGEKTYTFSVTAVG
ncbi:MAG: aldose 1-epimerase family protein [Ruminococcus sp.]|nr:aldose 1-epimerase family protein [Ruminococcus sp.]MCM1233146.1 aldose 1-epimerase family protein [Ruminococcus flavefaciens]